MDSDHVIEKKLGCSIRQFFEIQGEAAFRDLEQSVIAELTLENDCVLATGGGAILSLVNRQHLRQRTTTIYLHSEPVEVLRRVRHDQNRPLLQVDDPLMRLKDLYAQRDPLYRETADILIETGRPTVTMLVSTIMTQLGSLQGLHTRPRS